MSRKLVDYILTAVFELCFTFLLKNPGYSAKSTRRPELGIQSMRTLNVEKKGQFVQIEPSKDTAPQAVRT
jgi:hypothetical protein